MRNWAKRWLGVPSIIFAIVFLVDMIDVGIEKHIGQLHLTVHPLKTLLEVAALLMPSVLGSALKAASTAGIATVVYRTVVDSRIKNWDRLQADLNSKVKSDSGGETTQIELKMVGEDGAFARQFSRIRGNCSEVMLVLKQAPAKATANDTYELKRFLDQIKMARERVDKKNEGGHFTDTKLEWVCFVDHTGRFIALQQFADLWMQREERAVDFLKILNKRTPAEFESEIERHYAAWYREFDKQYNQQRSGIVDLPTKFIRGLEFHNEIPEGITKRRAIAHLTSYGEFDHSMLISAGDQKPIGVVSLSRLIDDKLIGIADPEDDPVQPTQSSQNSQIPDENNELVASFQYEDNRTDEERERAARMPAEVGGEAGPSFGMDVDQLT